MAKGRRSSVTAAPGDTHRSSPPRHAAAYNTMLAMENVLEKLKCLNYEAYFVEGRNQNPIGREEFCIPSTGSNSSLQFQHFLNLTTWLFSVVHASGSAPTTDGSNNNGEDEQKHDDLRIDQYDDPNTIVHKVMIAMRELGFDADFPATKLKTPYGEAVVKVLDFLSDVAFDRSPSAHLGPVQYNHNDTNSTDTLLHRGEDAISCEEGNDIMDESLLPSDDDDDFDNDNAYNNGNILFETTMNDDKLENSGHSIIETSIDPYEWRNELERVGPRLRAPSEGRGEGWRYHLVQTISQNKTIHTGFPSTEAHLLLLKKDMEDSLEKTTTKEGYLNKQFNALSEDFAQVKSDLNKVEESYHNSNQNVNSLSNKLVEISDELTLVKKLMEEKNGSMSDTTPIVEIKLGLQKLKAEIKGFDLRIGVVNHIIQSKLLDIKVPPRDVYMDDIDDLSFESEKQ